MDWEQRAAENGDPIPPLRDELARWAPSGACMVNKIAALLRHWEKYLEIPPRRKRADAKDARRVSEAANARRERRDARRIAHLRKDARSDTSPPARVCGENPETMRFENVPWPLQRESQG